jgi:hypothetical protein
VLNEPKFQKLAKLYERKHVPISTPANFGGTSWAEVVKRNNKEKAGPHKPPQEKNSSINQELEARLIRMEQAIDQIINHLGIYQEKPNNEARTEAHAESFDQTSDPNQSIAHITEGKIDKGKKPETTIDTTPLTIINSITSGNETSENKIKNLSQAFAKYHKETELRMGHLERNMSEILARYVETSDAEMDTHTYPSQ